MGKEGDLWDDSALINAFDDAISSYKKMHITSKNKEAEGIIQENVEISTPTSDAEAKINIPATDSSEISKVSNLEENHQPCLDSTNGQDIQIAHNGYSYGREFDDYSQLVGQYYELEEKRLKILDQINQYGSLNYQHVPTVSDSGVPYSNAQDYWMPMHQVSDPYVVCSCCPDYSQCALASSKLVPGCSVGKTCAGKHCKDGKIREMAVGAAERALSTIRRTISGDLNVNEEKESKNPEPEQIGDSETDLTTLMNAWYSAGFFTGKYLAEKSSGNKRQV
ncbi:unnamed protein product [Lathyrus sativus]|nr:unnamed protein product [Lathyrus sativus]